MLAALKARFNGADDFCLRELTAGGQVLYALFLDGMTSGSDISDFVVRPLMENLRPGTPEELYAQAQRGAVWCAVCEEADSAEAAADKLTHGYCVVAGRGAAPPRRRARTPSRARRMRSRKRSGSTRPLSGGICARRSCGLRARPSGGGRRRM